MKKDIIQLPQNPDVNTEITQTPDSALANTINKLTSKVDVEMLGNLDNDGDVARLALLINIGSDIDLGIEWLKDYAYTELALTNSLRTKIGGIRSEHLVKITKNPDMIDSSRDGLIQRIGNKFRR